MFSSYPEIKKALAASQTSCADIVEHCLAKIDARNAELNVFLGVYADEARAQAKKVDAKIASGTAGKLAGMVVGLKDVICYKDHPLQSSSKILDGFVSQFSATATERLLAEDAIIIGRQNCDEFAMGSSNENSAFGPTRNAADTSRVPGGSSGASAVAVQAGMCLVSLGSDTGGSVRQPAAFCGVVGLKPTYSRISRHGLVAYASSFDTIGIVANNVADAALVLEVIAGQDDFDSTVSLRPVAEYSRKLNDPGKKKVAILKETMSSEGLNPEIRANVLAAAEKLKAAGHEVEYVDFPLLDFSLPTYYVLTTAEASTNLSRFDGVRFGYRTPNAHNLETMYKKTRSEGFGQEVQRRILLGTFVLSASYYDAYFTKAQKVRRLIKEKMEEVLSRHDFILSPTTPTTAFKLGAFNETNLIESYLADLFTVPASVAGLPAISIPNGNDAQGLPIGIQLIAKPFGEEELLAFADAFGK